MKLRVPAVTAAVVLAIGAMAAPAAHAATGVVISQAAFGGPGGGNDEVVEIRNTTAATIDISGWTLMASNDSGTVGTRATVPAATTLPAGKTFVFANSAGTFTAQGDVLYGTGVTNTGGIQIRNGSTVMDAFGSTDRSSDISRGRGHCPAVERRRRIHPQERRNPGHRRQRRRLHRPHRRRPPRSAAPPAPARSPRVHATRVRTASHRSPPSRRSAPMRRATAPSSRSTAS